jgi:hypothetical protein
MTEGGEFVKVNNEFLIEEICKILGSSSEGTDRKKYYDIIMRIYEKWIKNNVPHDIESRLRLLVEQSRHLDWALFLTNKRYRDHYQHQFNVGALGWFLLQSYVSNDKRLDEKIAELYADRWELKDVHTAWWISSLLHDHGYPISYWLNSIPAMRTIGTEFKELKSPLTSIEKALNEVYYAMLSPDFGRLANMKSSREDIQETVKDGLDLIGLPSSIETELKEDIYDHGMLSATNLALMFKNNLNDILKESAKAIALHSNTKIDVKFEDSPIAFLLILCDEIQEWGRKMIISDKFKPELEHIRIGPFLDEEGKRKFNKSLKVKFEYGDAKVLKDTNWNYELFNKSKLENFKRLKFTRMINPQKIEFEVRIPSSI